MTKELELFVELFCMFCMCMYIVYTSNDKPVFTFIGIFGLLCFIACIIILAKTYFTFVFGV